MKSKTHSWLCHHVANLSNVLQTTEQQGEVSGGELGLCVVAACFTRRWRWERKYRWTAMVFIEQRVHVQTASNS